MFENNGHIHVYSPGTDNTLGQLFVFFFKKFKSFNLVICCKFFPFDYYVTVFLVQKRMRPDLTLS